MPTVRRSARRSHLNVPRETRPKAGSRPAARAVSRSPSRSRSSGPVARSRSAERVAGKEVADSWSLDWRSLALTLNYVCVSFLALYMVAWILYFPATWRAGSPDHDAVTEQAVDDATGRGVVGAEQFRCHFPPSFLTFLSFLLSCSNISLVFLAGTPRASSQSTRTTRRCSTPTSFRK